MPIKVQNNLPAKKIMEKENIFMMDETRAVSQDIRPLYIAVLNLMPLKEALRQFETAYIQRALDQTGTLKEAADVLGISFSSLCRKKAELGISKAAGSGKKNTGNTL